MYMYICICRCVCVRARVYVYKEELDILFPSSIFFLVSQNIFSQVIG